MTTATDLHTLKPIQRSPRETSAKHHFFVIPRESLVGLTVQCKLGCRHSAVRNIHIVLGVM